MAYIDIDGIDVIVDDNEKYFQVNDISGSDLSKIWERIKTEYVSYEKWLCYHNYDIIPCKLLDKIGAVLEDDSIEARLTADNCVVSDMRGVIRVLEDKFDDFAEYHTKCNPQCGAKSERIKRDFSRWGIFALLENNIVTDYLIIFTGHPVAEIFCIEASDSDKCKALISFACKYAFINGNTEILYMADENTISHKAALSIGFVNTGIYKGYKIEHQK